MPVQARHRRAGGLALVPRTGVEPGSGSRTRPSGPASAEPTSTDSGSTQHPPRPETDHAPLPMHALCSPSLRRAAACSGGGTWGRHRANAGRRPARACGRDLVASTRWSDGHQECHGPGHLGGRAARPDAGMDRLGRGDCADCSRQGRGPVVEHYIDVKIVALRNHRPVPRVGEGTGPMMSFSDRGAGVASGAQRQHGLRRTQGPVARVPGWQRPQPPRGWPCEQPGVAMLQAPWTSPLHRRPLRKPRHRVRRGRRTGLSRARLNRSLDRHALGQVPGPVAPAGPAGLHIADAM